MTLADFDGNILCYVIAAVIGLISWLTKKGEKIRHDEPASPKFPRAASTQPPEDERLRRFLEALGVPADKVPPPPVQKRQPPPLPQPLPKIQPRGDIVAGPWGRSAQSAKPEAPPPLRPAPSTPLRKATEMPAPARETRRAEPAREKAAASSAPVEKTHLAPLVTAPLPEFVTASSHVSAIPFQSAGIAIPETDAYGDATEGQATRSAARIGELLRSPADLRAAILLREILGPAPGLQRPGTLPTFP
jgi:hypothetical protein